MGEPAAVRDVEPVAVLADTRSLAHQREIRRGVPGGETAIRAADTDGNPRTIADPTWTPLLVTPPFPSYVSGHASFSGAAAAVLKAFFRSDRFRFTLPSEDPSIAPRSFSSFSQAARESADSRLYGGIHWRSDNKDGLAAGRRIGNHVFATLFRPLPASLKLRSSIVWSRPV